MERDLKPTGLTRYMPILSWLPGYPAGWLRFDLIAGLTAAAVVIPQAMAYAAIAGLPVQVGLYTALIPMLLYALLGASRPLSVHHRHAHGRGPGGDRPGRSHDFRCYPGLTDRRISPAGLGFAPVFPGQFYLAACADRFL